MEPAQIFRGKVAVVTGASRGLDAAIATCFAAHGCKVVINYNSSADKAEAVANDCTKKHGAEVTCIKADVSKRHEVATLFEQAKRRFGRIDVVVSNSGIEHFGDVDSVTEEEIDRVLSINVKGNFFVAQEAYKHLEDNGRLIMMTSISAVVGFPRHSIYAASKAAIQGMVKCLAHDFGTRNITVNCIAPGGTKTEMYAENHKKYVPGGEKMTQEQIDQAAGAMSPMKRPGMPDEIASVAAFIASPGCQWMTGETFHVSGGAYMI